MSELTDKILARLASLKFHVRAGGLAPFDEELPLVTGVAWDAGTAQFAIVAELEASDSDEAWRQLLFASSGLRHQVAGEGPAAFGAPIVFAVVDEEGERRLRSLSEDLAERYALFNRVDLNLVRHDALGDEEALDVALAPLLPKCRELLGQEISRIEVQRFWNVLRTEVEQAALALDDRFSSYREAAGRDSADALIGDSAEAADLPAPWPVRSVELRNFRSFTDERIELEPVTVIHGPNGGGKTSVVEALELAWAGRSHRHPPDVEPGDYARHLPRDGVGEFAVSCDDQPVPGIAARPRAELRRSVLGQDTLGDLVGAAPDDRYRLLLGITGLEIPDLSARTETLVTATKREADAVLGAAGIAPLPRRDTVALRHLMRELAIGLSSRLPATSGLIALQNAVEEAAQGAFKGWTWDDGKVAEALARADGVANGVVVADCDPDEAARALDAAHGAVEPLATKRHEAAVGIRMLLDALAIPREMDSAAPVDKPATKRGLELGMAVRWLSHARGISESAARFRSDASTQPEPWATRLIEYAEALERAAETIPRTELERLARSPRAGSRGAESVRVIDEDVYRRAGFVGVPPARSALEAPLRELLSELDRQADALMGLADALEQHPARTFGEHAPRVLRALCRFELARTLRRAGPVMRASEKLVGELLQGRLTPVLRELVAAIARFEWYFKPLTLSEAGRAVVIGGLATSREDLDARLVLNAAERTVVGVAWFLALHLLQPEDRRRVLVLDDPTGAFDMANQAGFVSTLRAFVRLTHPEQVVVTTHDDVLAAVLAEELAPVDAWPAAVGRIRCQRNGDDASFVRVEWSDASTRATSEESERLGLGAGGATLLA